ncbi:aminoglycoside phosphotransferase [Allocatelliglobosispora scoriae]|uniref:Aminoglycoside phosphotransferase n=1 Tax=Allocatelliglobosispora scoriae TaxID=643052 RepID=A0A841BC65_9ACTN|nr:phosphotransferase [Allocatelliglobosispora scoriae]MBB5866697.1 aminoglycoside phosphotransferase [Allocatelliglobosispora scoriae]
MTKGRFTEPIMTAAMRKLAAAHALDDTGARLLRLTNNAVFALPQAAVVIRITRSQRAEARVAKGVELAHWFDRIDAPTIRLAGPEQQPIWVNGLYATVWRYLPPSEPTLTPSDLGPVLRQFHQLGLPPFELPAWNPVGDARRRLDDAEALDDEDHRILTEWCDALEQRLTQFRGRQADTLVHGDAHVGNLLRDNTRPVLCDFDPICIGPWQADLVAVAVGEDRFGRPGAHRALADSYGYDVRHDDDWPLLREARELKMIAAVVPLLASAPGVAQEFRVRLDSITAGDAAARWTPFAELIPAARYD